jgi:hypothetical protein
MRRAPGDASDDAIPRWDPHGQVVAEPVAPRKHPQASPALFVDARSSASVPAMTRTAIRRALLLPLLALVPAAPGAELQVGDLRLELGLGTVAGYELEYDYTPAGNSQRPAGTYTVNDYRGGTPVVTSVLYTRGLLHQRGGLLWAAGIEATHGSGEAMGESLTTATIGLKARCGYGLPLGERAHLELMPELQLGYLQADDVDVAANGDVGRGRATGHYSAIGLHLGGDLLLGEGWVLGASLRGLAVSGNTSADFDLTGASYDSEYSYVLWSFAVSGGWRF